MSTPPPSASHTSADLKTLDRNDVMSCRDPLGSLLIDQMGILHLVGDPLLSDPGQCVVARGQCGRQEAGLRRMREGSTGYVYVLFLSRIVISNT